MPAIGIVDDRENVLSNMRDSVRLALLRNSLNEWEVFAIFPHKFLYDYPSWISQNEIVALIIDERLNEVLTDSEEAVSYEGHGLVDFLRSHIPEIPIFVVTSNQDDSELLERFKYVEDIIERSEYYDRSVDYIARITRSGQRFLQTFEDELTELANFATKVATGETILAEERDRAKAIQTKLETAFPVESIASRSEWLSHMEQLITELETLQANIEEQIGDQP